MHPCVCIDYRENPQFMWEERVCIYDTPRVPNNFPRLHASIYKI